jgi:hypothetical protein
MQIFLHGGKCCGIKQICGFGMVPNDMLDAKLTTAMPPNDRSGYVNSELEFFHRSAPKETYLERLDRYLAYVDEVRPGCVVEACLGPHQISAWEELLKARGFKAVTRFFNSNSHVRVTMYHRITFGGKIAKTNRRKPLQAKGA